MSDEPEADPRDGVSVERVRFSIEVFGDTFTILDSGVSSRENAAATLAWVAQVTASGTRAPGPDDSKHRGPAYRRGETDGRLAAFADASDLTPLIANRSGLVDPAGELHGIASDSDDDTTRERLTRIARAIRGEDQE